MKLFIYKYIHTYIKSVNRNYVIYLYACLDPGEPDATGIEPGLLNLRKTKAFS